MRFLQTIFLSVIFTSIAFGASISGATKPMGLYLIPGQSDYIQGWNAADPKANPVLARALVAAANAGRVPMARLKDIFDVTSAQIQAASFLSSSATEASRLAINSTDIRELLSMGWPLQDIEKISPSSLDVQIVWADLAHQVAPSTLSDTQWIKWSNRLAAEFWQRQQSATGTRRDSGWIQAIRTFEKTGVSQLPAKVRAAGGLLRLPGTANLRPAIQDFYLRELQREFKTTRFYSSNSAESEVVHEQAAAAFLDGADEIMEGDVVAGYLMRVAADLGLPSPALQLHVLTEALIDSLAALQWSSIHPARVTMVQKLTHEVGEILKADPQLQSAFQRQMAKVESDRTRAQFYRVELAAATADSTSAFPTSFFSKAFTDYWSSNDDRQDRRNTRVTDELALLDRQLHRLNAEEQHELITKSFLEHLDRIYSNHKDPVAYENFLLGLLEHMQRYDKSIHSFLNVADALLRSDVMAQMPLPRLRDQLLEVVNKAARASDADAHALQTWVRVRVLPAPRDILTLRHLAFADGLIDLVGTKALQTQALHDFYKNVIISTVESQDLTRAQVAVSAYERLRLVTDGKTFLQTTAELSRWFDDPVRMYFVHSDEPLSDLQDKMLRYLQATEIHQQDGLPVRYSDLSCGRLLGTF